MHSVGKCERSGDTIEPIVSSQWFVKTEQLAKPAIQAVKTGEIEIIPKRFEKVYFNWMENIKDWCISRQLWWGHQIPVWYCADCDEVIVNTDADNQYEADDIPLLVAPILEGRADIVIGARPINTHKHFSFTKKILRLRTSLIF